MQHILEERLLHQKSGKTTQRKNVGKRERASTEELLRREERDKEGDPYLKRDMGNLE